MPLSTMVPLTLAVVLGGAPSSDDDGAGGECGDPGGGGSEFWCEDGTIVDIAMVYVTDAVPGATMEDLERHAQLQVASMNTAFLNTDIAVRLRLVKVHQVVYEFIAASTLRDSMTYGVPTTDHDLRQVRDLHVAWKTDLVGAFANHAAGGSAHVPVVWNACTNWNTKCMFAFSRTSVVHEIGHCFGASHGHGYGVGLEPWSGAHIFTAEGTVYQTVELKGYEFNATLGGLFSNPLVEYRDEWAGDADEADNARTINAYAPYVANYQTSDFIDADDTLRIEGAPELGAPDGDSNRPAVSGDGRYVVFSSAATNLVANDTNGKRDIFRWDRTTGDVILVSVADDGSAANAASLRPAVSENGQHVAFSSWANNLIGAGLDTNNSLDVFLRDLSSMTTVRVSVADDESQLVMGNSDNPSISDDGCVVAFDTTATNVSVDDTNGVSDIAVRNLANGSTVLASRHSSGAIGDDASTNPSISGDGRQVAFEGLAGNLDDDDAPRLLASNSDVFVHALEAGYGMLVGETRMISKEYVGSVGGPADGPSFSPSVSKQGRYVAFATKARNLTTANRYVENQYQTMIIMHQDRDPDENQMYEHRVGSGDPVGAVTAPRFGLIYEPDFNSLDPCITGNGELIVFHSAATNFPFSGHDENALQDVYLWDSLGRLERLSVSSDEVEAIGGNSQFASISDDGKVVVFGSRATNLIAGDAGNHRDVFARVMEKPDADPTDNVSVIIGSVISPSHYTDLISPDDKFFRIASEFVPSSDEHVVEYEVVLKKDVTTFDPSKLDLFRIAIEDRIEAPAPVSTTVFAYDYVVDKEFEVLGSYNCYVEMGSSFGSDEYEDFGLNTIQVLTPVDYVETSTGHIHLRVCARTPAFGGSFELVTNLVDVEVH